MSKRKMLSTFVEVDDGDSQSAKEALVNNLAQRAGTVYGARGNAEQEQFEQLLGSKGFAMDVSPVITILFSSRVVGIKRYMTAAIQHYEGHPKQQSLRWGEIIREIHQSADRQCLVWLLDHLNERSVLPRLVSLTTLEGEAGVSIPTLVVPPHATQTEFAEGTPAHAELGWVKLPKQNGKRRKMSKSNRIQTASAYIAHMQAFLDKHNLYESFIDHLQNVAYDGETSVRETFEKTFGFEAELSDICASGQIIGVIDDGMVPME